jgi:hypothetical protein
MNIAINGAGWVGCHLAKILKETGFDIALFDRFTTVMSQASRNNQCRLHQGFHYPRSFSTIEEQAKGFPRFIAAYGQFLLPVKSNIYAVSSEHSFLDYQTYQALMQTHALDFEEIDPKKHGLSGVDGAMCCGEMAIDNVSAASFFEEELRDVLRLGSLPEIRIEKSSVTIDGTEFDMVVNATSNLWNPLSPNEHSYELCTMGLYRSTSFGSKAITIMDGPFASIYPCPTNGANNLYLLSGVDETVVKKFGSPEEAQEELKNYGQSRHDERRMLMEKKISKYYSDFKNEFTFIEMRHAIKVKPKMDADGRRWYAIKRRGPIMHVYASKIIHSLFIGDEVLQHLAPENKNK